MELNVAGTKGHYVVRDNTERVSKGCIVSSYANIVIFAIGFGLMCTAYFVLSSLATSITAELGSFSLAVLYFGWQTSQVTAPSLVDIFGAKICAVGSGICSLIFSVSYFHPTWYTIMPSSLVIGIGYGLLYAASGTIKNDEVQKCVERFKVDPMTYQGRFGAIIVGFGLGASSFLSGVISIVILSFSDSSIVSRVSCTANAPNASNITMPPSASVVSTMVYYVLVATMAMISLLSIVTVSIMRGAAYHQCRVRSFKLKEAIRNTARRAVKVLKQACTPAYGLVLPLLLIHGANIAYFYGVFTKVYVTECVGIEFVGLSVIVWGAFAILGSFGSGWLMRYTTSYAMVLVCIGGLEVGSLVFLIAWERQPSFGVIVTISAVFGLSYGLIATVELAYSGTAPGDSIIGYSALVVEHTGATVVQFFVSEFISTETNLYLILVITILAVPLFTIADIHYGSGTSRNICGKKKLSVAVVENGNIQSEPAAVDSSCKENGSVSRTRKESTLPLVGNGNEGSVSDACSTPVVTEEDQVFN